MKKKIALLLSCITILSSSLNVFGATGLIINNKTYVPVRGFLKNLVSVYLMIMKLLQQSSVIQNLL